jgi:hypothetical protein
MADQGQVESPNSMFQNQFSLLPILDSQGFHDLIHSLDLWSSWLDDVLREHLVWLNPGKVAVLVIHHPVVVHQQLLHGSKVHDENRRVLKIPEPICFA